MVLKFYSKWDISELTQGTRIFPDTQVLNLANPHFHILLSGHGITFRKPYSSVILSLLKHLKCFFENCQYFSKYVYIFVCVLYIEHPQNVSNFHLLVLLNQNSYTLGFREKSVFEVYLTCYKPVQWTTI